jgi:ribosomal-protein-alanine N-acetyltransferase
LRVELDSLTARDRDEFLAAMSASRHFHRPWVSPFTDIGAFTALLERSHSESFEAMVVRLRDDGAIVGYFNLSQIVRGPFQSAYLGFAAVAAHARQGYMTEGRMLVLRRAFSELRLHRVEANIQPANQASIALVRRSGFVPEGYSERYLKIAGRWRGHERWAIRAEQWRTQRRTSFHDQPNSNG